MRPLTFVPRFLTIAAVTLMWLGGAADAGAQDRLFVGASELGAFGHFGDRLGPAPEPVYGQLVAGGRYISTPTGAYDTSTGVFIPAAGGFVVAVDPRRPRLFMHDLAVISVFDLERRVSTPLIESTGLPTLVPTPARAQLAADANELFVWRGVSAFGDQEIAVVDLTTGTVSRRFPIGTLLGSFSDWRVAANGARLLVADGASIRLLDATTGAAVASHPSASARIVDDRVNRRAYVVGSGVLRAFDDALNVIGEIGLRAACGSAAVFSPHTGRLYVLESTSEGRSLKEGFTFRYFLSVFDAAGGRQIDSRDITSAMGLGDPTRQCLVLPMAVLTAPGAPQDVAVRVSGRDVTLSWRNIGDASSFVLDVGLAPGRSDLTFGIGAASPVTLAGAPPGTYYLRVRGTNAFGVSRPSNEIAIVVR